MLAVEMENNNDDSASGNRQPTNRNGASHSNAPTLTLSQRKQVLYEWNDTRADYPDACVHELFEQQVARNPDAIAVIGGGKSLSYRELNERANQVAHYLRKWEVGPEVLVGVCMERTPEMVVALLGVWKSGGAYVPLDSSYPEERLSFMVGDAAVRVLLTEEGCKHLFTSMHDKTVCLDSDWPAIALEDKSNLISGATPSNLAYVMYTSGSTGKPKGAMILHRGLVNYLWWAIQTYKVETGGSVPVHSSISFDLTVTSLYPALLAGGQVELLPESVGAQNLLAALRKRNDRNLVKITPAHLEALSLQLSPDEVAGMTKTFVIGGENLLAESLRLWRDHAPGTRIINEYGPTETVVGCCVYELQAQDPRNGSVPIGRPIANTHLYILNEDLQPVALGEMGELYIGGAGVARGYLNRPDLTQERFLPDPFSGLNKARMYKTGDLARYRDDGIIEYLGRADNQVKIRGYRIELGEIEAVLASFPSVQSCVVLAREDTPGEKQLVGYIVAREAEPPTAEDLKIFLKDRLPEYMIPAKFVYLDSFPLTHNGKIDRKALPAPVHEDARTDHDSGRPRTATEEVLASIWMKMFKIENVSIYDDFFDLGGHSLLAIRVMSRIREALGIDLPVQALFVNPTIAALADTLTEADVSNGSSSDGFI
jgi:amino acid adenylation domain-containing protein